MPDQPVFKPVDKAVTCCQVSTEDVVLINEYREIINGISRQADELQKQGEAKMKELWETLYAKYGLDPKVTWMVDRSYEPLGLMFIKRIEPQQHGAYGPMPPAGN